MREIDRKTIGLVFEKWRTHEELEADDIPILCRKGNKALIRLVESGDPIAYPMPIGTWPTEERSLVKQYWQFVKTENQHDLDELKSVRARIKGYASGRNPHTNLDLLLAESEATLLDKCTSVAWTLEQFMEH